MNSVIAELRFSIGLENSAFSYACADYADMERFEKG